MGHEAMAPLVPSIPSTSSVRKGRLRESGFPRSQYRYVSISLPTMR